VLVTTEDPRTISEASKPRPLTNPRELRFELRAQHTTMTDLRRKVEAASEAATVAEVNRHQASEQGTFDERKAAELVFHQTWIAETTAKAKRDELARMYGYESAASWDATFALFSKTYGSPLQD
jgi:hypothetical protein